MENEARWGNCVHVKCSGKGGSGERGIPFPLCWPSIISPGGTSDVHQTNVPSRPGSGWPTSGDDVILPLLVPISWKGDLPSAYIRLQTSSKFQFRVLKRAHWKCHHLFLDSVPPLYHLSPWAPGVPLTSVSWVWGPLRCWKSKQHPCYKHHPVVVGTCCPMAVYGMKVSIPRAGKGVMRRALWYTADISMKWLVSGENVSHASNASCALIQWFYQ